jgi:hypothetical protein
MNISVIPLVCIASPYLLIEAKTGGEFARISASHHIQIGNLTLKSHIQQKEKQQMKICK